MFFRIRGFKNIADLDKLSQARQVDEAIIRLRPKLQIAVIDDQEFSPLQNLQNHQYNITQYKDVPSFEILQNFQIVLVDLQGVGRRLNPALQGAHVIREIRKNYPEKFVIAYTGGAAQELLAPSIELADRFTQKDTSIEKWTELLDGVIHDLANPAYAWKRLRPRLLEVGMTPIELAVLEDQYVRCFKNDTSNFELNIGKLENSQESSPDVKAVLRSLTASGIIELFKALLLS